MGFSFGNLQGRGGWFGNCPILSMWFGNNKYYPVEQSIVLDSTGATVSYTSSYNIINLTASTTAWTVSSNVSWITATKSNASTATFNVSTNEIAVERTGIISFLIDGVVYATYTVTQSAPAPYIVLIYPAGPYGSQARTGTITVSANTPDWYVSASTAPTSESTGFTVTKTNSTTVTWSWTENTGDAIRYGYVNVYYGNTSERAIIQQNAGCVLYVLGEHTRTISSAETAFTISVVSLSGTSSTPVTYSIGYNTWGVTYSGMTETGIVGQKNFYFTCNRNTSLVDRNVTISFNQTGACDKGTAVFITREEGAPTPVIPGFTMKYLYGDWQLGYASAGTQTFPAGELPLVGIYLVNPDPITQDYTLHVGQLDWQWGPVTTAGTPTTGSIINQDFVIRSGATITVGDHTFNGIVLRAPNPRQQIVNTPTGITIT